jgi:hypothetical protein
MDFSNSKKVKNLFVTLQFDPLKIINEVHVDSFELDKLAK